MVGEDTGGRGGGEGFVRYGGGHCGVFELVELYQLGGEHVRSIQQSTRARPLTTRGRGASTINPTLSQERSARESGVS